MYSAALNIEEVKKFCADFYELEVARATKLEINFNEVHQNFFVVLVPKTTCADLLEATFKDGLLSLWGWTLKFKKNH